MNISCAMHSNHRSPQVLASGEFYGTAQTTKEVSPLPEQPIGVHAGEAISIARRVADECALWDRGSELLVEGLCWELLGQVARCNRGSERSAPRWLKKAKDLLHDGCALEFGVSDVARQIGVHPVHFVRAFRKFFNCTPGEYLRRCRVEKARSLVAGTKLSLSEAALESGYADQSQLSKAFKRYLGVSPREYRRNYRAHAQN